MAQALSMVVGRDGAPTWVGPVDALAVRAATRISNGHRLLDYHLLNVCLKDPQAVRDYIVRWRRIPTKVVGKRDISRQQGETGGYTAPSWQTGSLGIASAQTGWARTSTVSPLRRKEGKCSSGW
ncbi:MAG: hypothetical protein NZ899_01625 [Thermoguttaceae bacterium]|nr:hypothetical protein [Thermoguttaceae bacterium]MDW8078635.1 hypothetical protein [Thermoguttaceae bacterium]